MNVSDQLLNLNIVRQLLLQRVIAGENIRINKEYDAIAAALEKQLAGKELTEYQGKRLDKAVAELSAQVGIKEPDIAPLAQSEADFVVGSFAQVGITAALPPASIVEKVAASSLVQGATINQWFDKLNETTRFDVERTAKNGVLLGLTNKQIAKQIVGTGNDKGPNALAKARRDAMAITRTAVQTVANDARIATYNENDDIIKAVQWVSTLDSRTTEICMARSGKTWSVPDYQPIGHLLPWNGGPPAHWSCRSTTVPITKTFAELGIAADDITQSTRSSMDGQVAADLSFDDFLKTKPPEFADEMLGKGKAELWRSGKITLSQLLDAKGVPLTLAQLEAKYGAKAN